MSLLVCGIPFFFLGWAKTQGAAAGGEGEKSPLGQFGGTWRLVYSSAFASGSLGGFRPGPQAALVPVTIGQVPVQAWHANDHVLSGRWCMLPLTVILLRKAHPSFGPGTHNVGAWHIWNSSCNCKYGCTDVLSPCPSSAGRMYKVNASAGIPSSVHSYSNA